MWLWLWTIGRNCAIFRLSCVAASPVVLLWLLWCFFFSSSPHEERRWISQRRVVWGCFALLSVQLREGVGECYVNDREKEEKHAFCHVSTFKPSNLKARSVAKGVGLFYCVVSEKELPIKNKKEAGFACLP